MEKRSLSLKKGEFENYIKDFDDEDGVEEEIESDNED
jgi:hypothetical protein